VSAKGNGCLMKRWGSQRIWALFNQSPQALSRYILWSAVNHFMSKDGL